MLPIHPDGLPEEADPRLAGSFKNFLFMTWHTLGLPEPTPIQQDIADYMQYGPPRSITMGFRGVAKTYISVPYALWNLYRNPDLKILLTSATGGFASTNAFFAWTMLQTFDWLNWMRPAPHQKQAANQFDVRGAAPSKDPSFVSEGIFGQLTGKRADLIIPDDVEVPNTSDTEGARENLDHRTKEFSAILKPGGEVKYLGTAQCEDTVYLKREKAGYSIRIWPIMYPDEKSIKRYGGRLSPMLQKAVEDDPGLAGTSTEPTRFDDADIAGRRLEWGKTEFERQFLMFIDAGMGDSKPLKIRDLMVMDIDPEQGLPSNVIWTTHPNNRIPNMNIDSLTGDGFVYTPDFAQDEVLNYKKPEKVVCIIDPSGKGEDETTWTIGAERNGWIYVMWQGASLDGTSENVLKSISLSCRIWGVNFIEIESNFGQDMLADILKPYFRKGADVGRGPEEKELPVTIESNRAGQQFKEARIVQQLEPIITGHRMVLNSAILRRDYHIGYESVEDAKRRFYRLTYQMTRMAKIKGAVKHDDRVEGLANLGGHFSYVLKSAQEDRQKQEHEHYVMEQYRKMEEYRQKHGLPPLNPEAWDKINGSGMLSLLGGRDRAKSPLFGKRK